MSRVVFLLVIVILAFAALLLSAMNPGQVAVELAFVRVAAPLGLALVIAVVAGLVAGLGLRAYWIARLLRERGRLRRALRQAESKMRAAAAGDDAA